MKQHFAVEENKDGQLFGGLFSGKLVAAFSGRARGNMSLNYSDTSNSLVNRRNFLESFGIDCKDIICAKQNHGANVRRVGLSQRGSGALSFDTALPDTDVFVTNEKKVPLTVFTADCLPIFLFDSRAECIALIHAGWRGTHAFIARKALDAMVKEFGSRPGDVLAGFGPAIRGCCYRVGEDFQKKFPRAVELRGDSYFLDLAEVNRKQLNFSGIKSVNMFDCAICTCCRNSEYFSFRKEGFSSGRMMSVMMLV